jgi:uncharacterized protein (DUF1499 family)
MSARYGWLAFLALGLLGVLGCAGQRPKNLGAKDGVLAACPASPNCVSSQAGDTKHHVAPFVISGDPERAFANLKKVLELRRDTTIVEQTPDYLRVELRTLLFVDDGEFLLDRTHQNIQVRSASRIGYSDFGKNRSRMEEIRSQFLAAAR